LVLLLASVTSDEISGFSGEYLEALLLPFRSVPRFPPQAMGEPGRWGEKGEKLRAFKIGSEINTWDRGM